VYADPLRLKQVLDHLLTNAARYSPVGTEVRITARTVATHSGAGSAVEVAVADQGAGFTAEQRERIFEPFYRGRVDLTGKHPGAGLGLAISRGLVEAQGGRIWAESRGPGAGAVFRFTLPLAAAEATPVDGNPAAAGPTKAIVNPAASPSYAPV
jgi:signal transduction histidine kinase